MSLNNIQGGVFLEMMKDENSVILDVRTPTEYQASHIPGSVLLNYNDPMQFVKGSNELDKDKTYLVYCRSGARSAAACAHLSQIGFDDTYNLLGGILDWQGPVEK